MFARNEERSGYSSNVRAQQNKKKINMEVIRVTGNWQVREPLTNVLYQEKMCNMPFTHSDKEQFQEEKEN